MSRGQNGCLVRYSGARRSRSAPQDRNFAPCYIYYCTVLVHGYYGELFYVCSMICRSITEYPRRGTTWFQPVSSCLCLLHFTFCFPKPLSSSKFPLPPAESLHQFSRLSTVRCHGFLPGFTLSTPSKCLASRCLGKEVTYWKCRVFLRLLCLFRNWLRVVLVLCKP